MPCCACIMQGMTTDELQKQLRDLENISEFSRHYKLPLRTLMRIRAGGGVTKANAKVIGEALTWNAKRLAKELKK